MDPRSTIQVRPTTTALTRVSRFPPIDVQTRTLNTQLENVSRNAPGIRDVAAGLLENASALRTATGDLDTLAHGAERARTRATRRATGALYDRVNEGLDTICDARADVRTFNASLVLLCGRTQSETAASVSVRRLIEDLDVTFNELTRSMHFVDETIDRVTFDPPPAQAPPPAPQPAARVTRYVYPSEPAQMPAQPTRELASHRPRDERERIEMPRHREPTPCRPHHRKHRTTTITTTTLTREPDCVVM